MALLGFHVLFVVSAFTPLDCNCFVLFGEDCELLELLPDILFNKDDNDDFGDDSVTLALFEEGDVGSLDVGASRLGDTAIFGWDPPSAILRAFTLAFHNDFTRSTFWRMFASFGPLQIRCFSILPTSLPSPDCLTILAVTGKSAIFFKR